MYHFNSKWINNRHMRTKTNKTTRRKWVNLHDCRFSDGFLDLTPKAQGAEEKHWTSSKLQTFLHQRILSRMWNSKRKYSQVMYLI